jgi:hypothetical protein
MKRLLLLTLLLSLAPSAARAAFVQGQVNNANAASVTCTEPGNVTLGNMEIVAAKANGGGNFTTVTSTRATWVPLTVVSNLGLWIGTVTSTGAETITVNLPASNLVAVGCLEYSLHTTNDTSTVGGPASTTVNITTTQPNSTLVCVASGGLSIAFSGGAGFTLRETAILLTGPNGHLIFGDVDEASTGTFTCNTANGGSGVTVADFYAAAASIVRRHR